MIYTKNRQIGETDHRRLIENVDVQDAGVLPKRVVSARTGRNSSWPSSFFPNMQEEKPENYCALIQGMAKYILLR